MEKDTMLYHVTRMSNVPSIIRSNRLISASTAILDAYAPRSLLTEVRRDEERLQGGVTLNDQQPLSQCRPDGRAKYSELLNLHVYFWPNSPLQEASTHFDASDAGEKARAYGRRYFSDKMKTRTRILLRMPRREVESANQARGPLFSTCNSGSPDHNADLTRLIHTVFTAPRQGAIEVVFRDWVDLPSGVEAWHPVHCVWQPIRDCWAASGDECETPRAKGFVIKRRSAGNGT